MKYRYKNPLYLNILVIILAIVQVVMIFLTLAKFFHWFHMFSLMLGLEITQLVLSTLILVVCIFMLTPRYVLTKNTLQIKFGFFDITRGDITLIRILSVVKKAEDNSVYLNVFNNSDDPVIMRVNIDPKEYDSFIKRLMELNANIVLFEE